MRFSTAHLILCAGTAIGLLYLAAWIAAILGPQLPRIP
jgi:hypothetical protein